jgi:NADH-quinone oxidoreductase subunit C
MKLSPTSNLSASLEFLLQEISGLRSQWKGPRRLRVDLQAETLPALIELLKGRAGFVHLSAISCVDWPVQNEFELVYQLWSYEAKVLVMAHIRIPRDPGIYLSVYDLYRPAAFFERDIHEMFGLFFEGSPDMGKFILTEWDGPPPMRKEFDGEAWVMNQFDWQDYQPDWLKDIEAKGGGITTRPEDIRQDKPKPWDEQS